ncbi:uncharacterized protein LOC131997240 [Stomoxys calcitrans]|uniref:uncharacterized protein LOC131997240 n=1 Tax=Stomoxys calcitrans TaxID=35570 RepID=UPI0027E2F380|nr:uncharacterized protein LOC131997240 [Stomoxys calcitrans]
MLQNGLFFLIIWYCLNTTETAANWNFILSFPQLICKPIIPQVIKRLECSYSQLGPNQFSGSGLVMLNQQLGTEFDVHVKVTIRTHGKYLKFLDLKLNVCDTLKASMSVPLIRKLYNNVLQSSNFPRKCPVKANVLYNISNLIVDRSYFPKYTPSPMDFNFSIDYFVNEKKFAMLLLEGTTVPVRMK